MPYIWRNDFLNAPTRAVSFLDIKGASDHALHSSILSTIRQKSCSLDLIIIISSFLENHSARFFQSTTELLAPIRIGCPQGSVLSPLLWNLAVDEVFNIPFPTGVAIYGFANDSAISMTGLSIPDITSCLQISCNYCSMGF